MRLSNSKLVAATPIAALVLAASATAAPLQSRPVAAVKAAPAEAAVEATAEEADDGCACTCAKCLEKHGPKAAPAANVSRAKAPVKIEIMQSSDDAKASGAPRVEAKATWKIELAAPAQEDVVEEEVIIETVEISDHNETDTDQPFEAAEVDEVAELAREVEAILASELDVITEEAIAIAAAPPGAVQGQAGQDSGYVQVTQVAGTEDERGFLGVALGVDDDGVAVSEVMDGSPAESSGLQAGDVLFRIGRRSITSMDELREAMAGTKPGDAIVVGYMRDGRPQRTRVMLAERESVVAPAEATRVGSRSAVEAPSEPAVDAALPADAAVPWQQRRVRLSRPLAPDERVRLSVGGSRPSADVAPRARDGAPADSGDRSLLHAAQAETDEPVQAVMSGDDVRIVVMMDGTVRITASNVRVQRRTEGRGTSANSISKLDTRFNPERAGSLIDWVRGARIKRTGGGDARAADARAADARGNVPQRVGARRGDAGREDAALRRRIREMSAEIDRLSRQVQRIGRALGDR